MPLILDTDLWTIMKRQSQPASDRLQARLQEHPADEICVTILTFEEQVRGWMSSLSKARTPEQVLRAYTELRTVLRDFSQANVLPFDQAAQDRFADFQKQKLRIGTIDLRIACIAMTTGATLLSRNLRDFRKVPGLAVEDWTR